MLGLGLASLDISLTIVHVQHIVLRKTPKWVRVRVRVNVRLRALHLFLNINYKMISGSTDRVYTILKFFGEVMCELLIIETV